MLELYVNYETILNILYVLFLLGLSIYVYITYACIILL